MVLSGPDVALLPLYCSVDVSSSQEIGICKVKSFGILAVDKVCENSSRCFLMECRSSMALEMVALFDEGFCVCAGRI